MSEQVARPVNGSYGTVNGVEITEEVREYAKKGMAEKREEFAARGGVIQ